MAQITGRSFFQYTETSPSSQVDSTFVYTSPILYLSLLSYAFLQHMNLDQFL